MEENDISVKVIYRIKFLWFPRKINNRWYWLRNVSKRMRKRNIVMNGQLVTEIEEEYEVF